MLGADEEDLDDSVLGELIDPLADEGADDEAAGIEAEIEIDEPPELSRELALDEELELDTGGALDEVPLPPEQGFSDDDSTLGLDEVDTMSDLEALTPLEEENLPDGPDEPLPELDLPELDESDSDEPDAGQSPSELPATSSFGDDPLPVAAERSWLELTPSIEVEACGALTLVRGTALAASTDLLWFSRGELSPLRLEAGATRVHSVALIGEGREIALCSTTSGRLLRRGRSASAPEELRSPRALPDARVPREPLDLHQSADDDHYRVVARAASGQLLSSDDGGATYARASEKKALALSGSGQPIAALSEASSLLLSRDGGRSFDEQPLSGVARELAKARAPMISASREVVVLGAEQLGVVLSIDGGRSFSRVPGTRGVTALVTAEDDGAERVFVAVENEAYDRSLIIEIDPRTGDARSIAAIQSDFDEEANDPVRVARLAWDAELGRLWVAGAFGIRVFAPPSLAL